MAHKQHWDQDKESTVYIGNIDERATPEVMYEIMLQMGPIHNFYMPRDRVTQRHQGFGFVEFRAPHDADYASNNMNGVKIYGKPLRVNKATSGDKQRQVEVVGAELFLGNLDPMVDEKVLYDTFSRFGQLAALPKISRDAENQTRGFGFVAFTDFDASDAAIEAMNEEYLLGKKIVVQYSFKKDGKGERHGDQAERELVAQAKKRNLLPEVNLFSSLPTPTGVGPTGMPPYAGPGSAPVAHGANATPVQAGNRFPSWGGRGGGNAGGGFQDGYHNHQNSGGHRGGYQNNHYQNNNNPGGHRGGYHNQYRGGYNNRYHNNNNNTFPYKPSNNHNFNNNNQANSSLPTRPPPSNTSIPPPYPYNPSGPPQQQPPPSFPTPNQ